MLFFEEQKINLVYNNISILFCFFQMATTPITQEKVHKAKMSIENFYANLINQYEEREERYRRLEEMMNAEGLSDQEVNYCVIFNDDD